MVVSPVATQPPQEQNYYEEPPQNDVYEEPPEPAQPQKEASPFQDEGTIFLNKGQCARALYDYQAGE